MKIETIANLMLTATACLGFCGIVIIVGWCLTHNIKMDEWFTHLATGVISGVASGVFGFGVGRRNVRPADGNAQPK